MVELTELVGGEERGFQGGKFLYVERTLNEAQARSEQHRPMIDYIKRNFQKVYTANLGEKFPGIGINLTSDLVFLDIETCGLSGNDMIHTISQAKLNGTFTTKSYFARTPLEEETIVAYALDQILPPNVSIFTYNGETFDFDRLNTRAQMWGLLDKRAKTDMQLPLFEDFPSPFKLAKNAVENNGNGVNHSNGSGKRNLLLELTSDRQYDLMRKMATVLDIKKIQIRGRKLQTLEKALFGVHRSNEIPGKRIPIEYETFVYQGGNEHEVAKIIEHNILDVISLLGLLTYICTE